MVRDSGLLCENAVIAFNPVLWGAVRKILYLTDLAQKLLSQHIFSYLCA